MVGQFVAAILEITLWYCYFFFTILQSSVHIERLPNSMEFECIVFEEIKFKHREKCHFDTSKIGLVGHIGFPIVV
jgi:hypothetical protein